MVRLGNSDHYRHKVCMFTAPLLLSKSKLSPCCLIFRPNDTVSDPAVRQMVQDQTKEWTEMMERHRKEEWEILKAHLTAQEDILKKMMEVSQAIQMKQLEAKHDR